MNKKSLGEYYQKVSKDLEGKLTKADEILSSMEAKLSEADSNREQGASTLNSLNDSYQKIIELINKTHEDLTKVADLRTQAFDETTGIEVLLAKISTTTEKAEKVQEQISSLFRESEIDLKEIKGDLDSSKKNLVKLDSVKSSADSLLENLQKTYELAINTGLAGAFDKRKREIQDTFVNRWDRRYSIALGLLFLIGVGLLSYSLFKKDFSLEFLTYRVLLITPLVFYTAYSALQYGKERRLLEKYAFKATVATSLESYINILTVKFSPAKYTGEILNFVVTSMRSIYKEPHEEIFRRRYGLLFGNKWAQIKSEIIEDVKKELENSDSGETTPKNPS